MSDEPTIRALEQFGRQLNRVIPELRRRRRTRRVVALVTAGVTLAAAPALATSDLFDFGANTPRPGQPGGPPAVVTNPQVKSLPVLAVLLGPDGVRRLREAVAPYGLRVEVQGRPVAPAAVGRLFGVQFPRRARFTAGGDLVLEKGSRGTIIATLGRPATAGQRVGTAGLSLDEVLPQVGPAVHRDDPKATLARLRALGFTVSVKLVVDNPDRGAVSATGVKDVTTPPDGTVVLSILNARGQNTATPRTRKLIMEVAPSDSEVARSHP